MLRILHICDAAKLAQACVCRRAVLAVSGVASQSANCGIGGDLGPLVSSLSPRRAFLRCCVHRFASRINFSAVNQIGNAVKTMNVRLWRPLL